MIANRFSNSEDHSTGTAGRIAKTRRNKAGMKSVGRDSGSSHPAREFASKENVVQLRAAIGFEHSIARHHLRIVVVDLGVAMGIVTKYSRSLLPGVASSRSRRTCGHDEIRHVIQRERALKAVFSKLALAEHRTRIVHQDVDTGFGSGDLFCDSFHFGQARSDPRSESCGRDPDRARAAVHKCGFALVLDLGRRKQYVLPSPPVLQKQPALCPRSRP